MFSRFKNFTLTLFITTTCISLPLYTNTDYVPSPHGPQIVVNNTVLAKVNGKPISVVDIVKKLEMLFYQQYPDYAFSSEAKFEFFSNSWQYVLRDMINAELILADAEQRNLEANDGEIHQQLENNFGPDVIENLEKANLTFEDAYKMIRRELTANKMLDMLQFKAIQQVTPSALKEAFDKHFSEIQPTTFFHYQVLSFSSKDEALAKECSNLAKVYLRKEAASPEKVKEKLEQAKRYQEQVSIELSPVIQTEQGKLSSTYSNALSTLKDGEASDVLEGSASKPFRVFFLAQKEVRTPPSFKEVERNLNDAVFQEKLIEEQNRYLTLLRDNFAIHESDILTVPDNYQPFYYR